MKKSNKTKLIAMSFAVGALLTGCEPKKEQPAEVYGPPTIASTEYKPVTEEPQNVYGPPTMASTEYNPTTEEPVDVYGPPIFNSTETNTEK